jgi:hypothetical protein
MSLLYCYGITGEKVPSVAELGLEKSHIYQITFKDIFAAVSDVSEETFSQQAIDKNVKDIQWLTDNAPIHENVVSAIMQATAILPMKFCTIFNGEGELLQMLEGKYADIKYFLHRVQGKVEMSLKVYCDLDRMKEQVRKDSAEIQQLEEQAAEKTPGQAYFIRQKSDILLKDQVGQKILDEKEKILNKLKVLFIEVKKNDVLARKITGKEVGTEMVLNLALLVDKDTIKDLNERLDLKEGLDLSEVLYRFELTGPFAPYNFIR